MSVRLQVCIGILVIVLMIIMMNMLRKKKIDLKYSLGWLLLCVAVLILDICPWILGWFAELVGMTLPSNMIFMIGIILIVIMLYFLTASVSRLSEKNKRLVQEVALLREELRQLKEKQDL